MEAQQVEITIEEKLSIEELAKSSQYLAELIGQKDQLVE